MKRDRKIKRGKRERKREGYKTKEESPVCYFFFLLPQWTCRGDSPVGASLIAVVSGYKPQRRNVRCLRERVPGLYIVLPRQAFA